MQFIEALEDGKLDVLPAACFSAGFIKTYCRLIELDPNYYVDAYGAAAHVAPKRFSLMDYKKLTSPRSMAGELIVWSAICVILVAAWTVYSVVVRPATGPGQGSVQAGALMVEDDTADSQPAR